MEVEEFVGLLNEGHEIEFLYLNKCYKVGVYWVTKFGMRCFSKRGHSEYWIYPPIDGQMDAQKFTNIDGLLSVLIEGKKLKDIIGEIEIVEVY